MNITITTKDGKVYTDPREVHIERNSKTELFYSMVENFVAPINDEKKKEGASA